MQTTTFRNAQRTYDNREPDDYFKPLEFDEDGNEIDVEELIAEHRAQKEIDEYEYRSQYRE